MCGIIGYVGHRPCRELLVAGLERLEYRGYDSAGMTLLSPGGSARVRSVGNLSRLRAVLRVHDGDPVHEHATTGLGHTRWATHGRVSERNAHPHADPLGRVHIVLNGIIENHDALRDGLSSPYTSETDAEVLAHLIAVHYERDFVEAVRRAASFLRGHFSFVAGATEHPGLLVGGRQACPLVVGVGETERFLASAAPAFLEHTRSVQAIDDGEIVAVTAGETRVIDADGDVAVRVPVEVDWSDGIADRGDHDTFMLKEIHEQPDAVAGTLDGWLAEGRVWLPDLRFDARAVRRLVIVACGTSYHAGLLARHAFERWAKVPVDVEVASEWRYRDPFVRPDDLVLGVTQSGETADTVAAMRLAREHGARVLAVTNVAGSLATREADATLLTAAGLEIGVAATKTFTCQVAALAALAIGFAQDRETFPASAQIVAELERLPALVGETLDRTAEPMRRIATACADEDLFLFLGRHAGVPAALEGALKLKEISYVPSEAYAAGEMKHGPIALLSEGTPVIAVATASPVVDKLLSNLAEARARGAWVLAIASDGLDIGRSYADELVTTPATDPLLAPLLATLPMQLLAYHVACLRGHDVDQPRNLAKTVTVE